MITATPYALFNLGRCGVHDALFVNFCVPTMLSVHPYILTRGKTPCPFHIHAMGLAKSFPQRSRMRLRLSQLLLALHKSLHCKRFGNILHADQPQIVRAVEHGGNARVALAHHAPDFIE